MTRRNWQREELLLALNLYCRLPFGKYHSGNSQIIALAQFIDRTPDAVAMKLTNFASFDPYHQERGVKGLQNTSKADREIWEEFNTGWDELATESEALYEQLSDEEYEPISPAFAGETETTREVKVRLGQRFFRKVILTSYQHRCCICGIPLRELLVASHIVPWHEAEDLRVNPHNGLCLCALHDKGFDCGLLTIDEEYQVMVSDVVRKHFSEFAIHNSFEIYDGQAINLPDKFIPEQDFLMTHRNKYFIG